MGREKDERVVGWYLRCSWSYGSNYYNKSEITCSKVCSLSKRIDRYGWMIPFSSLPTSLSFLIFSIWHSRIGEPGIQMWPGKVQAKLLDDEQGSLLWHAIILTACSTRVSYLWSFLSQYEYLIFQVLLWPWTYKQNIHIHQSQKLSIIFLQTKRKLVITHYVQNTKDKRYQPWLCDGR